MQYVVAFVIALEGWLLVLRLRDQTSGLGRSPFEGALSSSQSIPLERPARLTELERTVALAQASLASARFRLQPILRAIASDRLRVTAGVDLAGAPEDARRVLGDSLFEIVRAGRNPPDDSSVRGASLEELAAMVDTLEGL
jgi:hypothetical protein